MTNAGKPPGRDELAALIRRGDSRQAKGDSLGALADYERALREARDDPMLWNNRGVALASLGRFDEAIGSYRKAIEKRSRYWNAWFNLGKALQRNARRLENEACRSDSAQGEAGAVRRAASLADIYEEAVAAYDRALELDPRHPSSLNNKALSLYKLGRYPEALEVYDALINMDPAYAHGWFNKGEVLVKMGFPVEARRCFEVAGELDAQFRAPTDDDRGDRLDIRDVNAPRKARRKTKKTPRGL